MGKIIDKIYGETFMESLSEWYKKRTHTNYFSYFSIINTAHMPPPVVVFVFIRNCLFFDDHIVTLSVVKSRENAK